ncbi:hypothetical protein BD769DRAFT_1436072 [Suillus cothurnatus]|nr:hypothetical protein BD769DRAFT_1436072 [Suillus cothurnatus]
MHHVLILSNSDLAAILCFGALDGIVTAFIATFGPIIGLFTMIITRFSSGYFSGTIYSALNIPSHGHSGKSNARQYQSRYPSARVITGMCCLIPCFVGHDMGLDGKV